MDTETMRAKVLMGIDRMLDAPWIVRQLESAEDKKMLRASRSYWQNATTTELTVLLTFYNQEL